MGWSCVACTVNREKNVATCTYQSAGGVSHLPNTINVDQVRSIWKGRAEEGGAIRESLEVSGRLG